MLNKRIKTYTFQEFFNKDLIEEINYLDRCVAHLKRNKKKYMLVVTIIALTVNLSTLNVFALGKGLSAIDEAGMKILTLVRRVGYWICLILCGKDVIKQSMRGHIDSIGTTIAMYGLAFGALYFLPWLFDLIEGIF